MNSSISERICLHDNYESMQVMIIALSGGAGYEFFSNKSPGNICFFGLQGTLQISVKKTFAAVEAPDLYALSPGSCVVIDKQLWRHSSNPGLTPVVYAECIDGPFRVDDKNFI